MLLWCLENCLRWFSVLHTLKHPLERYKNYKRRGKNHLQFEFIYRGPISVARREEKINEMKKKKSNRGPNKKSINKTFAPHCHIKG